jgi:DNA-binding HxlR family transcriptional regulator
MTAPAAATPAATQLAARKPLKKAEVAALCTAEARAGWPEWARVLAAVSAVPTDACAVRSTAIAMRSYDQYCALAKALDLVGDRWSLLIVRELLLRPCRYGELQDGLPGMASNLLVDRLRSLEDTGVVTRDDQAHYRLTDWGNRLATPVRELVRWAAPLMSSKHETDTFRSRWLEIPLTLMFDGVDRSRPQIEVEIRSGDQAVTLASDAGEVSVRSGTASSPDVVISGPPEPLIGLLAGRLDKAAAFEQGVSVLGDFRLVTRLRSKDWLDPPQRSVAPPRPGRSARLPRT